MKKSMFYFIVFGVFIISILLTLSIPPIVQSEAQTTSYFTVQRIVIADVIEDREPVGISETFPTSTERVYCFIEATDIKEDTEVTFVWYNRDEEIHSYTLPLKQGSRWRTFTYKNLRGQTGNWKVDIKDSSGNVVESISFQVE